MIAPWLMPGLPAAKIAALCVRKEYCPEAGAVRHAGEMRVAMASSKRPSLRLVAAKGLFFTGAAQAYRILIGFATSVLLVRMLAPADFGLVAMVSSCVAFVGLVQNLGLTQATIQREDISHGQASGLFWVSLGFSTFLAFGLAALAPAIAHFFNDGRVTNLAIAFSLLVVFGGLQAQQLALMNRALRFKALAAIDVFATTASALVGVTAAWLTKSYWSLFLANLASIIVGAACAWGFSGWRPGRPAFEGQFKEIFSFGSGISGFNLVNYFARNADNLLIGRFYGSEQLGFL